MLCRKDSLSSVDRATTRRLVQSTFAKVASTQGKDLSEVYLVSPLCDPAVKRRDTRSLSRSHLQSDVLFTAEQAMVWQLNL